MKRLYKYLPIVTVILLVAVWYIAAAVVNAEIIMPSPTQVILDLGALFSSAEFYVALSYSLLKTILSFMIALFFAILFSYLSYEFKFIERLLYPIVIVVRSTPTMSLIFLCLIWFSSQISPIIVSFTVLFPMLYASLFSALNGVDEKLIEMSRAYNVPRKIIFTKVYLPHVVKSVYPDLIAALSFNVKLILAAEAWAQTRPSLGLSMYKANVNLLTSDLFALTVVAIILGFILELIMKFIRYIFGRIRNAALDRN